MSACVLNICVYMLVCGVAVPVSAHGLLWKPVCKHLLTSAQI